jgi:SagB-type dehydrogenase family enzyme
VQLITTRDNQGEKSLTTDTASLSAREYHQRTKHSLEAYARGPETLDWDDQPDPFRRFTGCETLALPLTARGIDTGYASLFEPGAVAAAPFTLDNLAALLELGLGLSAWKSYGPDRWSLRCNPSSGNLHPTEAYVITADNAPVAAGVHHYLSHDHLLEQRCEPAQPLDGLVPEGCFLLGLSSIHWREAWKYGERAFRYCQLDVGHAMAAVRYAAAVLGWRVQLLGDWSDDDIAACLGLNRDDDFSSAEREAPDAMLLIQTRPDNGSPVVDAPALALALPQGRWSGQANALSARHDHDWSVIDQVAQACLQPATPMQHAQAVPRSALLPADPAPQQTASQLIRQRRSAQAFDGVSTLPLSTFCRMLDTLLPRLQVPPLDVLPWAPRLHLVFFVHRVAELAPGLYCLPRSEAGESLLRTTLSDKFKWTPTDNLPEQLPLYQLVQANCANAARTLSCHQGIAADSAFAVAMLAEFETPLSAGDWVYRRLFWEAGVIGQSLYLEAEAAGVRGTGIGCYFDDKTHEILGIQDQRLQDLYHFTVGTPQIDSRLVSLPPYSHLESRGS